MEFVLGIDQGTTNTKAVLVDDQARIRAVAERRIATASPQPGWVEQDPEAMLRNVLDCIRDVLAQGSVAPGRIAGAGICNQTETLVVWDTETGRPLHPAIVWQCRRSQADAQAVQPAAVQIGARTGLDLDPTFTATKLRWLAREWPDIGAQLASGRALWGTVDSWLVHALSGGSSYVTEPGNASRTMLFDISKLRFDDDLFRIFGLALARKPEVKKSAASFGHFAREHLGAKIPITGILGDQQASLFGHGCFQPGMLKASFGTGGFVWLNAGATAPSGDRQGLLATIAWQLDKPAYALEGFVMYAGAIIDWLLRILDLGTDPDAVARLAREAASSGDVTLVPAFQGLGSPWWDAEARASILGLSAGTERAQICRAGLEAICFQTRAVLEAMGRVNGKAATLVSVDGGMTRSEDIMAMQAAVLKTPLRRAETVHVAALGAALMAGVGAGLWKGTDEIRPLMGGGSPVDDTRFAAEPWDERYGQWRSAVDLTRQWKSDGRA
ncbi:MAG TPA: FGGY family carbohydrate kinase [Verrucomicrobiae bacterium]|nr:FGGY family carbohydrate kinase [Verrucomicrobiae bacterium]